MSEFVHIACPECLPANRVQLVKVNTEEASGLAARYGIRAIPTLVLLRNGTETKRMSGALDSGALEQWAA